MTMENWTDQMKQKLEGHKMAPPARLWEDISCELGIQDSPRRRSFARWYWTVAATVCLCVGVCVISHLEHEEPLSLISHAPRIHRPSLNNIIKVDSGYQQVAYVQGLKVLPKADEKDNVSIHSETEDMSSQLLEKESQQPPVTKDSNIHTGNIHQSAADILSRNTSASATKWSVSLKASGGLLASNHGRTNYDLSHSLSGKAISETADMPGGWDGKNANSQDDQSDKQADYRAEHHLPISLGLSLRYQLNPRLALLSGVNYTYLYSEFYSIQNPSMSCHQKLHYLGIPVGLSWQIWNANVFSLYLSGSAMLEKCLNEKPWQWSISTAIGVEYVISLQIGLYFEPSVGYYFNDGTTFEHYYQAHPLAPSIEFGLRLHLSDK